MEKNKNIYIMIVEDSPVQAKKLKFLLEENEYEVIVCTNGIEALRSLSQRIPTLIISDIMMPDMDGYEFCHRLKSDSDYKEIPVILVTTLHDPLDIIKGLQAQADNFITKPYEDQYLLMRVQYLLTNRELRKQGNAEMVMEIIFRGNRYSINSERKQILDLLLSVYEAAISRNEELIRTQKMLEDSNKELISTNKELEAFTRTVSHDLRSPIASIKSLISLVQEAVINKNEQSLMSSIGYIEDVSDKMLELVDDLLRLSKVNHSELQFSEIDLSYLATYIADHLKMKFPKVNTTIQIEKNLKCWADEKLMYVVLENLMNNAWKYSSKKENATITVGRIVENGKEIFFVNDNGAGFAPEKAYKLFVPFERLHTTSEFPGIGIGLATVKRVIERHNGTIWAESALGEGATFYWTLPSS